MDTIDVFHLLKLISKLFWYSVFDIFFVFFIFSFHYRFTILVVALTHHFILVGTFCCDGASDCGIGDLATFRHILNNVGNDFGVKLVFRWFARFDECYMW